MSVELGVDSGAVAALEGSSSGGLKRRVGPAVGNADGKAVGAYDRGDVGGAVEV